MADNSAKYIIELVLKARDDTGALVDEVKKKYDSLSNSLGLVDGKLESTNKKMSSLATRTNTATDKIGKLADKTTELKDSVKDFLEQEKELDKVVEKNSGNLIKQAKVTAEKAAATTDASAAVGRHSAITKDSTEAEDASTAAKQRAKTALEDYTKEFNEATAAANKHKKELVDLSQKAGAAQGKALSSAEIGNVDDAGLRKNLESALEASEASSKHLKSVESNVKTARSQFKALSDAESKARKANTAALNEETEALDANTEATERNSRSKSHRRRTDGTDPGTLSRKERDARSAQARQNYQSAGIDPKLNGKLAQDVKDAEAERVAAGKELGKLLKTAGPKGGKVARKDIGTIADDDVRTAAEAKLKEIGLAEDKKSAAKDAQAAYLGKATEALKKNTAAEDENSASTAQAVDVSRKKTDATKAETKAVEEQTEAVEERTKAVNKAKVAEEENPDEQKPGETKTQYNRRMREKRKAGMNVTKLESAGRMDPGSDEAKAAAARVTASNQESDQEVADRLAAAAAKRAEEQAEFFAPAEPKTKKTPIMKDIPKEPPLGSDAYDEDDGYDPNEFDQSDIDSIGDVGGFPRITGGAPNKKYDEEIKQKRESEQAKSRRNLKALTDEYQNASGALFNYLQQLKKGSISEEEWNARRKAAEQLIDRIIPKIAKIQNLGVIGDQALRKVTNGLREGLPKVDEQANRALAAQGKRMYGPTELPETLRPKMTQAERAQRRRQENALSGLVPFGPTELPPKLKRQAEDAKARREMIQAGLLEYGPTKLPREFRAPTGAVRKPTPNKSQEARIYSDFTKTISRISEKKSEDPEFDRDVLKRLQSDLLQLSKAYDVGERKYNTYTRAAGQAGKQIKLLGEQIRDTDRKAKTSQGGLAGFIARAERINGAVGRASDGLSTLDNKLQGLIVLSVIAFAQQLLSAITSLVGAFGALGASVVTAAGALGGSFAAGIAQLGPLIGLTIAGIARLKSIMDIVKQSDLVDEQKYQRANDSQKKVADTADAVAAAQDGVRSATEGLASAQDGLADANSRVTDAQQELTEARREAVKAIRDQLVAERDAELSARGAQLDEGAAKDRLRLSIQQGNVESLDQDELGVLNARQDRVKARNDLTDERQATRVARRGVDAQPNVIDAKKNVDEARKGVEDAAKGVEKAERAVASAQRGVTKARRGADAAAQDSFSAAEKLQYLLKDLTPAERRLYEAGMRLRETYKKNFRGVTDPIINEFTNGANDLTRVLERPSFIKTFEGLSQEVAKQLGRIRKSFLDDKSLDQIERITRQAKGNLEPVTDILINIGHAFLNIAEAANPGFKILLRYFKDLSAETREYTEDKNGMSKFFVRAAKSATILFDAIGATINLIAALSVAGRDTGDTIFEDYTKYVNGLAKSIREDGDGVKNFFEESRKGFYILLRLLPAIGKALIDVFDPERMETLVTFLTDSLIPALVVVINAIGGATSVLFKFLDLPVVKEVGQFIIVMLLFGKTIRATGGLLESMSKGLLFFLKIADGGRPAKLLGFLGGVSSSIGGILKKIPGLSKLGDMFDRIGNRAKAATVQTEALATANRTAASTSTAAGAAGAGVPGRTRSPGGVDLPAGSTAAREAEKKAGAGLAGTAAAGAGGAAASRKVRNPFRKKKPAVPSVADAADDVVDDVPKKSPVGSALKRGAGGAAIVIGGAGLFGRDDRTFAKDAGGYGGGTNFRRVFDESKGITDAVGRLDVKGVGRGLGRIVGGAVGKENLFGGKSNEDLKKYAETYEETFKKLNQRRDVKGLEELAKRARELKKDFPGFAKELDKASGRASGAAEGNKRLNKQLEMTADVAKRLKRQGIDINIKTRGTTPKELLEDVDYFLSNLRKGVPRSLRQLARDVQAQMGRIRDAFTDDQGYRKDGYYEAAAATTKAAIANVRRLRREGKITREEERDQLKDLRRDYRLYNSSLKDAGDIGKDFGKKLRGSKPNVNRAVKDILGELDKMPIEARRQAALMGIRQIREIEKSNPKIRGAAKQLAAGVGSRWKNMRDINVTRAAQMTDGTAKAISDLPKSVRTVAADVTGFVNKSLDAFGAKPVSVSLGKITKVASNAVGFVKNLFNGGDDERAIGGIVGTGAGKGISRYAASGVVGKEGERGGDDIPAWIGRGEMVLNHGHQRYIGPAVEAYYGHPLGKTFDRVRGFHSGGKKNTQNGEPAFAGGFAGKSPAGLKTVPIPGFPGEFVAQQVVGQAVALAKRFKMLITDGFARSGHSGAGHLKFGTAIDTVPGKGGSWKDVNRAVAYATSKGLTVLYDGRFGSQAYPNHGEGNHAHFELKAGVLKGGDGGASSAGDVDKRLLKVPGRKIEGRGAQRRIGQGAVNKIVAAAQRRINKERDKAAAAAGSGADAGEGVSTDGVDADGSVVRVIKQIWQKNKLSFKALLSAIETGIVESGLRNLPGGDRDSIGWRQERASLYKDPGNLTKSVARYFNEFKQFDKPGLSAGDVSANVQRPAAQYRGRYNAVRSKALQVIRGAGIKIPKNVPAASGGIIGGTTGNPKKTTVHGGEWIVNPHQQGKLASLVGVGRDKLKSWMGFTGSVNTGFAGGGDPDDSDDDKRKKKPLKQAKAPELQSTLGKNVEDADRTLSEAYSSAAEKARVAAARRGIYELPVFPLNSWKLLMLETKRAMASLAKIPTAYKGRLRQINDEIDKIRKDTTDEQDKQIANLKKGGTTRAERKKITQIQNSVSKDEQKKIDDLRAEAKDLRKGGKDVLNNRAVLSATQRISVLTAITQEGGLFDQLGAYRERITAARTAKNTIGRFTRPTGSGTATAVGLSDTSLNAAENAAELTRAAAAADLGYVQSQVKLIARAKKTAQNRLRKLKRGGIKPEEAAEARKLETLLVRIQEQDQTAQEALAGATEAVYNAQVEKQQAAIDRINKEAEKQTGRNDNAKRLSEAFGLPDIARRAAQSQIGVLKTQRDRLRKQIAVANKMGNKDLAEDLRKQVEDLDVSIVEGTQQILRDGVDTINKAFDRQAKYTDFGRRIGSALGNRGIIATMNQRQITLARDQVAQLTKKLGEASRAGNRGLVEDLQDQIADLQTGIIELVNQTFRDSIDTINEAASRRTSRLDLANRALDAFGRSGLGNTVGLGGEVFSRTNVFQQRGTALTNQRNQLQGVLNNVRATQPQNTALIQELTDSILELNVSIQENVKALFDARVSDTNQRASYGGGIIDLRKQIVDLTGQISGVVDNAKLLELERSRTAILQTQRAELSKLLLEAQAAKNQTGVEELTEQLLQNEIAILTNTAAVKELTGATTQPQTFQSATFQLFREAIYSGMGQVLPQYVVASGLPADTTGGSGYTRAANQGRPLAARSGNMEDWGKEGDTTFNFEINEAGRDIDMTELSSTVAFAYNNAKKNK